MNKRFDEIAEIIEGAEFRFHVNLAAGFEAFKRLAREQDVFTQLKEFAKHESGANIITKRVGRLLQQDYDKQYQHPRDAAIAGYLYALEQAGQNAPISLVSKIANETDFWWARKIAKQILAATVHIRVSQVEQQVQGDVLDWFPTDLWLRQTVDYAISLQPLSINSDTASDFFEVAVKKLELELDTEGTNNFTESYQFPTTLSFKVAS